MLALLTIVQQMAGISSPLTQIAPRRGLVGLGREARRIQVGHSGQEARALLDPFEPGLTAGPDRGVECVRRERGQRVEEPEVPGDERGRHHG